MLQFYWENATKHYSSQHLRRSEMPARLSVKGYIAVGVYMCVCGDTSHKLLEAGFVHYDDIIDCAYFLGIASRT